MRVLASLAYAALANVGASATTPHSADIQVRGAEDIKANIYLIRHGEKIDDDHVGLSDEGKERAQCVKDFFSSNSYLVDYIIAQDYKPDGKRIRPYETVKPLADKLGLQVDHHCSKEDEDCVYDTIKKASKDGKRSILVCWEHSKLTDIADKLDVNDLEYPDDRFDVVYSIKEAKVERIFSEQCPNLDSEYVGWVGTKDSKPKLVDDGSWAKGAGN
ncbi:hypothetical protein MCUN1_002172 [Malassezia cuniculi]|uniref:Phosphoglycerate mutase family protein n=1 Tax=Malassezia cuniculi TaxID=948313 RepID=A0AAF0EVY6_9BASI|nr:hypothetical protein MCUN1_002172 [Malassezia cuniculi]